MQNERFARLRLFLAASHKATMIPIQPESGKTNEYHYDKVKTITQLQIMPQYNGCSYSYLTISIVCLSEGGALPAAIRTAKIAEIVAVEMANTATNNAPI